MNIISRADWGARPPTSTPVLTTVEELYLHHSVGSGTRDFNGDGDMGDDYMRTMQRYHQDTKGWSDIAYNFAIDPVGLEVYEGRGWAIRPGSQLAHNTGTWSVVVMGNFNVEGVSEGLKERIAELVQYGISLGELPLVTLQGHRDAPRPPGSGTTSCPGSNLYRALPEINRLIEEEMVRRSDKADDGLAVLKPLYDDMVANGVFTTATQPGGVAFNDEVANFLARFEGYLQSKYDLGADGISLAQAQQIARQEIAKSSVKPADS